MKEGRTGWVQAAGHHKVGMRSIAHLINGVYRLETQLLFRVFEDWKLWSWCKSWRRIDPNTEISYGLAVRTSNLRKHKN